MLFTDGVGIGPRDPAVNPLCSGDYLLSRFSDGSGSTLPPDVCCFSTDTTFGMAGRPQSASNQTAIYTASDAPKRIGAHVLGYPNAALRELIANESIVKRLQTAGRTATFANAYPLEYLEALGLPHRAGTPSGVVIAAAVAKKLKATASTLAMTAGGIELRTFDDARAGAGLTHDIDGLMASRRDPTLPKRSAAQSAQIFWSLAEDFTLFEHFLADEAGHARDFEAASRAIAAFDAFAREVIAQRPSDAVVLICSDHGNVEDLSIRSHTRNPVAVLCAGEAGLHIHDVADVGRSVLFLLGAA